jgi:hypothetical protein
MAEVVKSYQYQMPPEYVQRRQQELLNTLFGVPAQGTPGEADYVPAVKGLVETPMDVIGQQVAGFSPAQQQAFTLAQQGIGGYMPYLQAAEAATGQAQDIATQAGQMFQPGAAQAFMDPYQQNVTQEALKEIRRQGDIARQAQSAQAVKAGAFGGGREGVVRAETERGIQDIMSRRIFEDLSRNYQQALAASQAAGAGQLQQAGMVGGLGKQYGALGTTAQTQQLQDIQSLLGVGGMQQQLGQAQLEAQRQNLMAQQQEPYRRYSYGLEALAGLPFGGTTIQQKEVPTANPFLQALSGVGSLAYGIGSLGGFGSS